MAALIAVAVAVVALSLALTVDADEGWWREHITRPQRAESLPAVVDALLTHLWLCVLVSLGVGYLWWRGRLTAVGQWLLVAVVVAEGLWFCSAHLERRFHWPQARVDWSPGLAQSLQKVSHGGRLATSPRLRHANWGGAHHVAVAGGYETAVPLWTNVYLNRAARRRTMRYAVNLQTGRDSPLLDRLAARHYLRRANERRLKGWKEVARSSGLALDRNPTPLPRAHFADQVRVETSRAKAMERLEKLPLTVTVLGDKLPHQPGGQAEIVGARWGGAEISLQTRTDRPKVLVIRDALAPGWSATIDDAPAQLTLADGLFRGVAVPAGEHTVMMRYRAPGLRLGGWTSVIGWALWLLLLVGAGRLSRREP